MFECLKELDEAIFNRYRTLERNIKIKSNSFYDAYLSLVEALIKFILDNEHIVYDDTRTCGYIIKLDNVSDFLFDKMKISNLLYEKIINYVKKSNDHKHKKEKNITLESIINHQKVLFDFTKKYFEYKALPYKEEFDENYYINLFGLTINENEEYKKIINNLRDELQEVMKDNNLSKEDLDAYKSLISIKEIELLTLEEQNDVLQKQIQELQKIKLNTLEVKLNKALIMLEDLKNYLAENRVANNLIYKIICGEDLPKEMIENEKKKLER